MLIKKFKNQSYQKLFKKVEMLKIVYKFLITNLLNNPNIKQKKYLLLQIYTLYRKVFLFSKTKITNRCILTNRGRGVIRSFNISRIKLRELLRFGFIPGYKKAVW